VSGSEAVNAAAHLVDLGAECAVVTLGERGLVTVRDGYGCRARIGSPATGNATGAGDAVAASLARSLLADTPWETALADAVAIATGAVVMPRAGEIDLNTAARMRSRIVVTTERLPNFPRRAGTKLEPR
jgi:1-phosphofructokinase/tagatose 6-phosphate kinase